MSETSASAAPLEQLAAKYVWWECPQSALADKHHFLACVMNLATWPDVKILESLFDPRELCEALDRLAPGLMSAQSWGYWHWRLGYGQVPPLPLKKMS